MMRGNWFVGLVGWCAATALASPRGMADSRPNVVIILADDLGIGDVSAYNENAAWETPNIDRLAASGMTFSDAHTSAAICTPTRYSIMTGRYNWRSRLKHGGYDGYSEPLIDADRLTLPRLFKAHGYDTAMLGKWHLGWNWATVPEETVTYDGKERPVIDFSRPISNGPEFFGFTWSYALAASLSSPPYVFVENSVPVAIPLETSVSYDEKAFWRKGPVAPGFRHIDILPELADRAVDYLHAHSAEERPFFLYVAFTAPHAPIVPRTEFVGRSQANAYGDFVLQVDQAAGRIIDAIFGNESLQNTLVFFLSDNGQSPRADFHDDELPKAGHHGSYIYRGKKFDVFEGGHRVPFIASWPGHIPAGSWSEETISTVDFVATAAGLLNAELPDNAAEDSYDILPVLLEREYAKPLREATVMHSSDGRFAIREGDWKLILWPGSGGWSSPRTEEEMRGLPRFQLYNLRDDPGETKNLVSAYPDRVGKMRALLTQYVVEGRSTPGKPQENDGPERWPELEWME